MKFWGERKFSARSFIAVWIFLVLVLFLAISGGAASTDCRASWAFKGKPLDGTVTGTATTTTTSTSTTISTSTTTSTTTTTTLTTTKLTATTTTTEYSRTTTTGTTSTIYVHTSYSPMITATTTVVMPLTYKTTTTTTTTSTQVTTSSAVLTTVIWTTASVTNAPTARRCIIASVAYGSPLAPEVEFLRKFRDDEVTASFAGHQFMKTFNAFYYSFSPEVAEILMEKTMLQSLARVALYPLVASLRIAVTALTFLPNSSGLIIIPVGVSSSALIGVVYIAPLMILKRIVRREDREEHQSCSH